MSADRLSFLLTELEWRLPALDPRWRPIVYGAIRSVTASEAACIAIAADLGVGVSTLNSRCARAGLASPKALADAFRLAVFAGLLADNIATHRAAFDLGASSAQAMGRVVRRLTGDGVPALRALGFDGAWDHYVLPLLAGYALPQDHAA